MEKSIKVLLIVVFAAIAIIALIGAGIYLSMVSNPNDYVEMVTYFVIGALMSMGSCLIIWAVFLYKPLKEDQILDSNITN